MAGSRALTPHTVFSSPIGAHRAFQPSMGPPPTSHVCVRGLDTGSEWLDTGGRLGYQLTETAGWVPGLGQMSHGRLSSWGAWLGWLEPPPPPAPKLEDPLRSTTSQPRPTKVGGGLGGKSIQPQLAKARNTPKLCPLHPVKRRCCATMWCSIHSFWSVSIF